MKRFQQFAACCFVIAAGITWDSSAIAQESAEQILTRARAVLSQLEGDVQIPGLIEPVEVLRDRWGIAHLYARNTHDLFLAQGYVAAQDRLFQLDLWRRIGVGETAEVTGEQGIEGDRFARLLLYRGDMQAEWKSYSPDAREIITAFTQGINAQIDQVHGKLPIEFQILGYSPKKWKPEDVLSRMSGIIMSGNWQREIARARLIAKYGLEKARLVAPTDPSRDFVPDSDLDLNSISPEIAQGYLAATRPLKFAHSPSTSESNNWVVDGTLSISGKPLLASDPHRALAIPSLRYLVHLHAPGWNVIGAGEPALPGVAIGHNENIAWGFTIVGTDQSDLYVEQTDPQDPRRYRVGEQWESMRVIQETIPVKGRAAGAAVELRFTRHGPVIYQDEQKHLAFALRWAGGEPGGAAYLGSLAVARARNRAEFLKALESWKIPCLNFVYADVAGSIGWVAAALTPIRKGWDGLLPVPGATGKYEWQGYLGVSELPQSFNPPQHFLATANHNILPPGYTREIGYEFETPYRFQRIQQRLSAKATFTLDDFQSIQHESTSLPAQALIQLLKSVEVPQELATFAVLLREWDGVLSIDSRAAPLYAVWLQELDLAYYATRIPKDIRMERGDLRNVATMLRKLSQPTEEVFGPNPVQTRDEMLRQTLTQAVTRTKKLLGDDPQHWRWGTLHTATLQHHLASLGPAYSQAFNLASVARSGDSHTPNNTRYNESFQQIHGASYRHVLDLADWDRGLATSTPGQSGQPGSPHYGDLLPLWAEAKYFPLAYSRGKVEEVTQHRLKLMPAGSRRNLPAPKPRESTGLKPLSEMTAEDRYKGQDGGLYGEGRNSPPDEHLRAAEQELARIEPLDARGKPSANGRIVFVSISMSNATQEFSKFKRIADSDQDKSAKLTIVDCAQGGQAMAEWVPLNARPWSVAEERIAAANVSLEQVQVAWVKLANIAPRGDLQEHGKKLERDTARVLQNAKLRFPNLRIAYLSSRIYGGYATTNLNPEPYAYESAFPVRWLIQSQIKGDAGLDFHDDQRPAKAPLLLWGPYLWADGTTPRVNDQLSYKQGDLAADGTHPSEAGREKVANVMLKFFKTDPLAKPWFAR